MASFFPKLPMVGDRVPEFEVSTPGGRLHFPTYCAGRWCVFFAHPANFTSAWAMYSAFLAMKERWLNERNAKLIAITNEPLKHNNDWSDKARRYIGIYLKAPVIEDLDFSIAALFGMASGRRPQPGFDRLAYIIDPQGIIRMIITRPLPNIETAILDLQDEFDRLQRNIERPNEPKPLEPLESMKHTERPDSPGEEVYKPKPAFFRKHKINMN
jgi:alkyl hydroperoxide reductase subunit AhpC